MRISAALVDDENYVNMAETRFIVEFTPRPVRFQLRLPSDSNWTTVQNSLLQGCGLSPTESAVRITYADDENERVLLSSEPEMQAALRVAEKKGNVLQIQVTEDEIASAGATSQVQASPRHGNDSGEFVFVGGSNASTESEAKPSAGATASEASSQLRSDAGDSATAAPAWFVDFVRTLRNELKDEVTAEVFKRLDERKVDKWTAAAAAEAFPDAPTCGNCRCQVQGVRYRCWVCPNYDLCEVCESLPSVHDSSHAMLKIRKPAGLQQAARRKRSNGSTFRPIRSPNRASAIREMKQEMKMQKLMKKLEKYNLRDSNIYRLPGAASSTENYLSPDSYDSEFVCDDTIPDWTHVQPGTRFTKRWKVRNSGNRAWDESILLKYCWGTLGLMPNDTDIEAPRLQPNEEGMLEVQFSAPLDPGHYQTHWRMFSPHGYFGHRLWCNVVVDPALTLEPKQKHMSSLKVVAGADEDFGHEQPGLKTEDFATGLKANIVSHTATPFNTPAAVTPRKSPEPEEAEESDVGLLGSNVSILDMPILHDTEESASVLSLSSVDTDGDFEVVPLPSCFNLNIPFNLPEPRPVTDKSDSDQSAATSCEVIAKPAKCHFCGPLQCMPSPAVAPPQGYTDDTECALGRFQDPLIESSTSNSSATQTSAADTGNSCDDKEKKKQNEATVEDEGSASKTTKSAFSTRKTYKVEGVGDALPEALVNGALSAAATVYNTAKTVFSGMQPERQRMSSPEWAPPPTHAATENKLFEMGFRNRQLNSVLLKKHSGDIQKVIEELISATAESWPAEAPVEGPPTARPFMCSFD
ncbi:next to BRCA1 gene 1 protein-like [Haemaphysalis longicornis]